MFFPNGNAEEFCDHVFRTFDRDKNGFIDFKVNIRFLLYSIFLIWRFRFYKNQIIFFSFKRKVQVEKEYILISIIVKQKYVIRK